MMAITCVVLISWIAMEVSYDSLVEYNVNSNSLNRLKAYYAAKSGVELSLLRIKTFQQAQASFGKQMGAASGMLDQIWKFPFGWPIPVPPELNAVDKDQIKTVLKESIMDASYTVTIEDEGSKIDLNDLVSPSKALAEAARRRMMQIFEAKLKDDEAFQKKYSGYKFDELINAVADWQTEKRGSVSGDGDKRGIYRDYPEKFPPNRGFRTIQEVRLVPGMSEDFFELLEPAITIYGMKAINPNQTTKEVLRSLDAGITDEVANEIIKRRDDTNLGGPFKNKEDFWGFIVQKGARLAEKTEETPLIFDKVFNFRIRSIGEYAGVSREITVVVMDLQSVASTLKGYVDKEKQAQQNANGGAKPNATPQNAGNPAQSQSATLPKGAPRIVYWGER
ncbi:MAG: general secretion pathway protein GspK [Bdellovibrionaceae bacterium]|nr:general secretion pathway protein GspK [Pseudobdellovibrionaceae bacterium]